MENTIEEKRKLLHMLISAQTLFPDHEYLAVDENGMTYLYGIKPRKDLNSWHGGIGAQHISAVFPLISFSDPEPLHIPKAIEKLRKELAMASVHNVNYPTVKTGGLDKP